MTSSSESPPRRPQVFLSYAQADRAVAGRVAAALAEAGLAPWFDSWELAQGDSIRDRINLAISSSDFLVVLLSPDSVASDWVKLELSTALARELRDRAVTVVPALVRDCEIPSSLADRKFLDLRSDLSSSLDRFVEQVSAMPRIDLSSLTASTFEALVGDLLTQLGFAVRRTPHTTDGGFDFAATFRSIDPFGAEQHDTWLVQVKLYKNQRASVSALRQVLGSLAASPRFTKGLVVTNSQLTSEARAFLSGIESKHGHTLRALDGTELTNLLLQQPHLVRRYFSQSEDHE